MTTGLIHLSIDTEAISVRVEHGADDELVTRLADVLRGIRTGLNGMVAKSADAIIIAAPLHSAAGIAEAFETDPPPVKRAAKRKPAKRSVKVKVARKAGTPKPIGDVACPDCDHKAISAQGVAVHRARKHGVRGATKKASSPTPATSPGFKQELHRWLPWRMPRRRVHVPQRRHSAPRWAA